MSGVERAYLVDSLDALPDLHDTLLRHYGELLSHGERTADPRVRDVADVDVIDLADTRSKRRDDDPAGEADLASRIGARRVGVLPTLSAWVRLAEGEMLDAGEPCTTPAPAPTITTEAGWLRMHLDWIMAQQWVRELAADVVGVAGGLRAIVGDSRELPDHAVVLPLTRMARHVGVAETTLRTWSARGWITPATDADGDVLADAAGRGARLFYVDDVEACRDLQRMRMRARRA